MDARVPCQVGGQAPLLMGSAVLCWVCALLVMWLAPMAPWLWLRLVYWPWVAMFMLGGCLLCLRLFCPPREDPSYTSMV